MIMMMMVAMVAHSVGFLIISWLIGQMVVLMYLISPAYRERSALRGVVEGRDGEGGWQSLMDAEIYRAE